GLGSLVDRRPGQVSGGQAQRIAIARALVTSPAVIFADEPTGALDQATGHEVMQMLSAVVQRTGAALILVTHDPGVADWMERRVAHSHRHRSGDLDCHRERHGQLYHRIPRCRWHVDVLSTVTTPRRFSCAARSHGGPRRFGDDEYLGRIGLLRLCISGAYDFL